jgi:hypothetical protein
LASNDGIESLVEREITVATARHDFSALNKKKHRYNFSIKVYKTFLVDVS